MEQEHLHALERKIRMLRGMDEETLETVEMHTKMKNASMEITKSLYQFIDFHSHARQLGFHVSNQTTTDKVEIC